MASHRRNLACAVFLAGALMASSAHAAGDAAQQVVRQSYAVLLQVMKEAKTLGYEGRVQRLTPTIEAVFNLPLMAQVTAGPFWTKATDDQRKRYIGAFGRMTTAILATRFDDYKGERFDVLGADETSPTSVRVRTQIVYADGHTMPLDYAVQNFGGTWKVTDIIALGSISEIAVKTADYLSVLQSGGIGALTGALDSKVVTLAEEEKQSAAVNGKEP